MILRWSIPERHSAIIAARERHDEPALRKVPGGDVLNVLFVSRESAVAALKGPLVPTVLLVFFPSMIFVVLVLQSSLVRSRTDLRWGFGILSVEAYLITVLSDYVLVGTSDN